MLRSLKSAIWLKGQVRSSGRELSPFRAAAERSLQQGNYSEVEQQLLKAIAEADSYGQPAPRVILRIDLADVQRVRAKRIGESPDRVKLYTALTTARAAIDLAAAATDAPLYVLGLDALAEILAELEDFTGMLPVAEGAVRVAEPLPDMDPVVMAQRTLRVALAWTQTGRSEDAAGLLVKAIEMQMNATGEESTETATLLAGAARIYRLQGDYTSAEEVIRTATAVHKATVGEVSQDVIDDYSELAQVLFSAGDVHSAATSFERAVRIKQELVHDAGEDAPELLRQELLEMEYDLAQLQMRAGDVGRAEELLRGCVARVEYDGTHSHWRTRLAQCRQSIATIEESCGRLDSAVDEFLLAADAWERCGPAHAQDFVDVLEHCAQVQKKLLRTRDAGRSLDRAAGALDELARMQSGRQTPEAQPNTDSASSAPVRQTHSVTQGRGSG